MELPLWLAPGWPRVLALTLPAALALGLLGAVAVFAPGAATGGGTAAVAGPPGGAGGAGGRPGAAVGAGQAGQAPGPAPPPAAGLLVEVSGAVNHPGLIRLPKGDRVYDAVAAAGGLAADADPQRLPDMAQRLRDGQQVRVPARGSPATGRGGTAAGGTRVTRVDLNSASADELATVPGFTAALAAECVRYRVDYGGFSSPRELVTVLGMSAADYQMARRYVRT